MNENDVRHIEARIEGAVRAGMATTLRAVAALYEAGLPPVAGARMLRELAAEFEVADTPTASGYVGLHLVVEGVPKDGEPDGDGERDEEFPVLRIVSGSNGMIRAEDGGDLGLGMIEWLDEFDDRLRMSPHFVTAVNEAADAGLILNDSESLRIVGDRVRELAAGAEERELPEEREPEAVLNADDDKPRGGMRAREKKS